MTIERVLARCRLLVYYQCMDNEKAERTLLQARLRCHCREFGENVVTTFNNASVITYRNRYVNHNYCTSIRNCEFHSREVRRLQAEWFKLTGEHFPVGFWLETRAGFFSKKGEKLTDIPMAHIDKSPQ